MLKKNTRSLKYYLPETETKNEARKFYSYSYDLEQHQMIAKEVTGWDFENAAQIAADYYYNHESGIENGDNEFELILIDCRNNEHKFNVEVEFEPTFTVTEQFNY